MQKRIRFDVIRLCAALPLAGMAQTPQLQAQLVAEKAAYVCPSCGSPCDDVVHAASTGSNPSPTLWSYQKAQAVLTAGVAALGGAEKIKALENIAVEFDGSRHLINQSRKPAGPGTKSRPLAKSSSTASIIACTV